MWDSLVVKKLFDYCELIRLNKPNTIDLKLNSRRMKKLITNNIINSNIASVIEIFFDAKGLNLVRVTF